MSSKARVVPLDIAGNIYAVVDEKGHSLGTGTKEVCEVLAQIAAAGSSAPKQHNTTPGATNVRSAITV